MSEAWMNRAWLKRHIMVRIDDPHGPAFASMPLNLYGMPRKRRTLKKHIARFQRRFSVLLKRQRGAHDRHYARPIVDTDGNPMVADTDGWYRVPISAERHGEGEEGK